MKAYNILLLGAVLLATIFLAHKAFGEEVTFAWDFTDVNNNCAGFVLYLSDNTETYTYPIPDPAARTATIDDAGLDVGTYDVWVTAYSVRVESDPSNTIQLNVDGFTPPENTFPVPVTVDAPALQVN